MTAHRDLQDGLYAERRMPDPGDGGNIVQDRSEGIVSVTVAGTNQTRVLCNPSYEGTRLSIVLAGTSGGTLAISTEDADDINVAANTTATMSLAGAFVEFVSVDIGGALLWRLSSSDGAVLS